MRQLVDFHFHPAAPYSCRMHQKCSIRESAKHPPRHTVFSVLDICLRYLRKTSRKVSGASSGGYKNVIVQSIHSNLLPKPVLQTMSPVLRILALLLLSIGVRGIAVAERGTSVAIVRNGTTSIDPNPEPRYVARPCAETPVPSVFDL